MNSLQPAASEAGGPGPRRHWDSAAKAWIVQILPGECYVSRGGELIATVLGSCVSTCIRDLRGGCGGMNHFMLPDDPGGGKHDGALRYGCFAIERLINEVLKAGAKRGWLEVKVFGGGQVIPGVGDIGRANVEFVREYLRDEGLTIVSEDVGGRVARRLRYDPMTGRALVKHLAVDEQVRSQEQSFRSSLRGRKAAGEVELF